MTAGEYVAHIVEVPDHGIKLEPADGTTIPDQPTEVNLLGMAVALALGAAGYQHHPEPRDTDLQTLDALLAGDAVMPWRPAEPGAADTITCTLTNGHPVCHVNPTAD